MTRLLFKNPLLLLILLIGLNGVVFQSFAADPEKGLDQKKRTPSSLTEQEKGEFIIVEPKGIGTVRESGKYEMIPYEDRRGEWSTQFSLTYGTYDPLDFDMEFSGQSYEDVFDVNDSSLIELELVIQRNRSYGSLAYEMSVGIFTNKSKDSYIALTGDDIYLEIIPVRFGARFALDTLFSEPYVVPYVSAGTYILFVKEKLNSRLRPTNTLPALYYSVGLKFQLNSLDPDLSRIAHQERGLENTYFFVEARQYTDTQLDGESSTLNGLSINGGLSLEL